eukprot:3602525-Pleurochrysis_carterae.AAC.2
MGPQAVGDGVGDCTGDSGKQQGSSHAANSGVPALSAARSGQTVDTTRLRRGRHDRSACRKKLSYEEQAD